MNGLENNFPLHQGPLPPPFNQSKVQSTENRVTAAGLQQTAFPHTLKHFFPFLYVVISTYCLIYFCIIRNCEFLTGEFKYDIVYVDWRSNIANHHWLYLL